MVATNPNPNPNPNQVDKTAPRHVGMKELPASLPGAPKHYGDLRHLVGQVRVRVRVKG